MIKLDKNGKKRTRWRGGSKPTRNPTPKEIREETRKIRENWDEKTYLIRAGFSSKEAAKVMQWIPSCISFDDLMHVAKDQGLCVDTRQLNENYDN
jgi:hypothetical protein